MSNRSKLLIAAVLTLAVIAAIVALGDRFSLAKLAEHESTLLDYRAAHPWRLLAAAFIVYILVAGLSLPPGALVLSLACGWLFGFWRGALLVSFASTAGATMAFLLSRYLLSEWVAQRFGHRWLGVQDHMSRDGAFYLFALRLQPVVPFFAVNLLAGLTTLRTTTFWWVSQVGMLPGTAVYVYAGSSLPTLRAIADGGVAAFLRPELIVALAALGVFPLAARWALRRWRHAHDLQQRSQP